MNKNPKEKGYEKEELEEELRRKTGRRRKRRSTSLKLSSNFRSIHPLMAEQNAFKVIWRQING
jgi:hypothetical protein